MAPHYIIMDDGIRYLLYDFYTPSSSVQRSSLLRDSNNIIAAKSGNQEAEIIATTIVRLIATRLTAKDDMKACYMTSKR
jgi:hypothetical protein